MTVMQPSSEPLSSLPSSLPLILASSSPRRHSLLGHLGLPFTIDPSAIDETPPVGAAPAAVALALAEQKAAAVGERSPDAVVIGADTLVDLDGRILNKPRDAADAERMLGLLVGRAHQVHSGVAVWRQGRLRSQVVTATVAMRPATAAEIAAYVAGGEPLDKAGAYAAQGEGASFIESVEGSYLAVVGLPLLVLQALLREAGLRPAADQALLARLERSDIVVRASPGQS
jgi:septum formation protein